MLSLRTVTPDTLELLKALMSAPELSSLRLVGGTALALQYGHRVSVDLDLFGEVAIDKFELLSLLQGLGEVRVINETKNIHQYFVNQVFQHHFLNHNLNNQTTNLLTVIDTVLVFRMH